MTIITTYFDRNPSYLKLLNVFYNSAKKYMPKSDIHIIKIDNLPGHGYGVNAEQDHHWDTYYAFMAKISHTIETDDNVLMVDCDILFKNSMDEIWTKIFDVAITVRNNARKYNTGVCFVRSTEKAKIFLKTWKEETRKVATEFNLHDINQWWGIDQMSLHLTLKKINTTNILELPCKIWNAEQTYWRSITNETKAVHIKSGLRRVFFGDEILKTKHYYLKPILEELDEYKNTKGNIPFFKSSTDRVR